MKSIYIIKKFSYLQIYNIAFFINLKRFSFNELSPLYKRITHISIQFGHGKILLSLFFLESLKSEVVYLQNGRNESHGDLSERYFSETILFPSVKLIQSIFESIFHLVLESAGIRTNNLLIF
jgi:hypothetical protein